MTPTKVYNILVKLGMIDEMETTLENFKEILKDPVEVLSFVSDLRQLNDDDYIDKFLTAIFLSLDPEE